MNKTQEKMFADIFFAMTDYMSGDAKRIQHFIKVHSFARAIGIREGVDEHTQFILEITALMHDIGIRGGERIYNRSDGEIQQKLGPAEAEKILKAMSFEPEDIERICFLIEHHHTYNNIDGLDYQILVEADFLVNLFEDSASLPACRSAYDKIFKTESGKKLMRDQFGL